MQGFVLINGYPNGEKFYRQGQRIAAALRNLGIKTDFYKNGEMYAVLSADGTWRSAAQNYDFAVYLDKDKYLGNALESMGLLLFNRAAAVESCDDKMSTYLALQKSGVPLIPSLPAPLCYTQTVKPNPDFLAAVEREFGFPVVVKTSYGSFGAGVALAKDRTELYALAERYLHQPHFYQAYLAEAAGRDIRVIVIGGKAVAAMERQAQAGEFRSNIELGGRGRAIPLTDQVASVAESAAIALGLDYCGVDVLQTSSGAQVCEVNSNAFFEGFEQATGLDVARLYAEHIVRTLQSK